MTAICGHWRKYKRDVGSEIRVVGNVMREMFDYRDPEEAEKKIIFRLRKSG